MVEEADDERNVCDKSWEVVVKKKKSVSDRSGAEVEPWGGGIVVDDKTIQISPSRFGW